MRPPCLLVAIAAWSGALAHAAPCAVSNLRVQQLPPGAPGRGTITVGCADASTVPEGGTCALEFPGSAVCDTVTCQDGGTWAPQYVTCAPSYWGYSAFIEFGGALARGDAANVADDLRDLIARDVAGKACPCTAAEGYTVEVINSTAAGRYRARVVVPTAGVTENQLRAAVNAAWEGLYTDASGPLRAEFKVDTRLPEVRLQAEPRDTPAPDSGPPSSAGGGTDASDGDARGGGSDLATVLIILAVALCLLVLLCALYYLYQKRKRREIESRELFDVDPLPSSSPPLASESRHSFVDMVGGEMLAGTPSHRNLSASPSVSGGIGSSFVAPPSRRASTNPTPVPIDNDEPEPWAPPPTTPRVGLSKQQAASVRSPHHKWALQRVKR